MKDFKNEIVNLLQEKNLGIEEESIRRAIEVPPTSDLGDYAFPCFILAKVLRKNPNEIASELEGRLSAPWLEKIEAKGPYLNFFLDTASLADEVLCEVLDQKDEFGASKEGQGDSICIDFSSTNIAKPFHIGHIRSTVQGDALASIYEFLGYETIRINYLGDYGTQFGMLINSYELWGDDQALEEEPIQEMLRLYVRYNKEAEDDEALMDQARDRFKALENGGETETKIWKHFKELSLREFQRVYDLLDIEFDSWDGEFYHAQFIDDVLKELEEKDLLIKDEGAMIVPLGDDMPPALILKSNGSSTYITRDIATALRRKRDYDFKENIYVVGSQQNLHFQQLKAVLKKMGYDWAEQITHVAFGMISLEDGAMSTRSGNVVFLEDVLRQAIDKTRQIMEERNPDLENKEEIAKEVGIGAVKFQELYNNRVKDYTFSWDEILNFDGETGPYVQYTAARAYSIMERAKKEKNLEVEILPSYHLLKLDEEHTLLRSLYDFPSLVRQAKAKKEPSLVTRHVVEIAKAFNKFYSQASILNAETEELAKERLSLVAASRQVIEISLSLLGIATHKKM